MIKQNYIALAVLLFLCPVFISGQEHSDWNSLLRANVKSGKVSYEKLKNSPKNIAVLDGYLAKLENWDLNRANNEQKLAFWINAYNAFTVKLILNHYPVESIRDIKNPWKRKIWRAAGKTLSLDEIEHEILRKEFSEPRIHFAIVCASVGCPDLDNNAFEAKTINNHLEERTRLFFTQPKNFALTVKNGKAIIRLNKIMDWFKDDFGKDKAMRVAFIKKYLGKKEKSKIQKAKSVNIKYLKYNWMLNNQ